MTVFRFAAVASLLGVVLSACTHYEPISLHGAGSMRVEVEVYKGPVTLSTDAQIAQTAAVMSDLVRAMDKWHDEVAQTLDIDVYAGSREAANTSAEPVEPKDVGPITDAQRKQWEADKKEYAERFATYTRAKAAYDAQWSEYQRRFQSAVEVDEPLGNAVCAYPQTTGGRFSADDWRDCNALLTAYQSSERVISFACYIIHTPPFEKLAPTVFLPEHTCSDKTYEKDWDYLYNKRTTVDHVKFPPPPTNAAPAGKQDPTRSEPDNPVYYDALNAEWRKCNPPQTATTDAFAACHEAIVLAMENFTTMLQSTAFRVADANIRHVPRERNFAVCSSPTPT